MSYDATMLRFAQALAPLLRVTACASHDPVAARESGEREASRERASDDDDPWLWREDETDPSPSYLLGIVGQSGIAHCPDGTYDRTWLALRPTIGRVAVSGPDDSVFDPVMDKAVLGIGQPSPMPEQEPLSVTPQICPPMQMRSDWTETPRGMRITREPHPGQSHFSLSAVRPLHELQARSEADHIVVTLRNPVPVTLRGVELRVHYEGCFGKPGSTTETTKIGELAVGAMASARVPQRLNKSKAQPGRSEFRAYSVQLVAKAHGVIVDLDINLGALGVESKCADR